MYGVKQTIPGPRAGAGPCPSGEALALGCTGEPASGCGDTSASDVSSTPTASATVRKKTAKNQRSTTIALALVERYAVEWPRATTA
jgi:hypothetical protein